MTTVYTRLGTEEAIVRAGVIDGLAFRAGALHAATLEPALPAAR